MGLKSHLDWHQEAEQTRGCPTPAGLTEPEEAGVGVGVLHSHRPGGVAQHHRPHAKASPQALGLGSPESLEVFLSHLSLLETAPRLDVQQVEMGGQNSRRGGGDAGGAQAGGRGSRPGTASWPGWGTGEGLAEEQSCVGGPRYLGHRPLPSQAQEQEAGSDTEQPGLEPTPIWMLALWAGLNLLHHSTDHCEKFPSRVWEHCLHTAKREEGETM